MLNVGWLTAPAGIWRREDPLDQTVRLPVPAYLVESASERILVDTGLSRMAIEDPTSRYGPNATVTLFELELDAPLGEQIDLSTLTKVVLTHLHFDHAGGLDTLPSTVPVFVQRREWHAGHEDTAIARNFYQPADYGSIEQQVVLVDGESDLLGDGSLRLFPTPGHTPGHQSVMVGERLVIGGDVVHYAEGLDDHRFPSFADDYAAQTASAERLRALRERGLTVLPGHDPDVLSPGVVL